MITAIVAGLIYILGYIICFTMMRIEHESEKQTYTKGDRALCIILSLLSFVMVLIILISAWVRQIKKSGYWGRPVIETIQLETE